MAEHHTYFVGGEAWGFGVWAHNACQVNDQKYRDGYDAIFNRSHGNALSSKKVTTLYELVDATTGVRLKWGISSNPASRYSQLYSTASMRS